LLYGYVSSFDSFDKCYDLYDIFLQDWNIIVGKLGIVQWYHVCVRVVLIHVLLHSLYIDILNANKLFICNTFKDTRHNAHSDKCTELKLQNKHILLLYMIFFVTENSQWWIRCANLSSTGSYRYTWEQFSRTKRTSPFDSMLSAARSVISSKNKNSFRRFISVRRTCQFSIVRFHENLQIDSILESLLSFIDRNKIEPLLMISFTCISGTFASIIEKHRGQVTGNYFVRRSTWLILSSWRRMLQRDANWSWHFYGTRMN
jgi:hypothetical protein